MLFNSFTFAIFLPIFFVLYWFVCNRNVRLQNLLIVIASYIFYGWWDWRFLLLISFSSVWAWWLGILDERLEKGRRLRLVLSFVINLGILGFFKYFNFFVDQGVAALSALGFQAHVWTLKIILPVGISFYTFQTLSYTIDVYRKQIKPTRDLIAFLAFVSYFPQLVAGPIERATNLLPQIQKPRYFNSTQASDGCRQMLWGFFKKLAIADSCAPLVNHIFLNYESLPGSTLLLGGVLFAFQIYGDFSGYSDIAIGCSRLFGIKLMRNFAYPYFSRDIAEFWRRWHISLSTWFRDYLYIPMGGSRGTRWESFRNVFVMFMVSGIWHGANWTFVAWGAYNAVLFLPLLLLKQNRKYVNDIGEGRIFPTLKEGMQVLGTFFLVCVGWVFFRAPNLGVALHYLHKMFDLSLFTLPRQHLSALPLIVFMVAVEWFQRRKQHGLTIKSPPPSPAHTTAHHHTQHIPYTLLLRWIIYIGLSIICFAYFKQEAEFIYFQF